MEKCFSKSLNGFPPNNKRKAFECNVHRELLFISAAPPIEPAINKNTNMISYVSI
jgi:hypothetical protein